MSIVVAVKKQSEIVMAADSQTSFGSNRIQGDNLNEPKIRRCGASLIATTGLGLYDNILDDFLTASDLPGFRDKKDIFSFFLKFWRALHDRYPFVNDQCDGKDTPFGDLDASFLIVNVHGIFHVASDMSVTKFEKYFAIGSGSNFSFGVLYALYDQSVEAMELARKAVEAAKYFNVYCGGKTQIMRILIQSKGDRQGKPETPAT